MLESSGMGGIEKEVSREDFGLPLTFTEIVYMTAVAVPTARDMVLLWPHTKAVCHPASLPQPPPRAPRPSAATPALSLPTTAGHKASDRVHVS